MGLRRGEAVARRASFARIAGALGVALAAGCALASQVPSPPARTGPFAACPVLTVPVTGDRSTRPPGSIPALAFQGLVLQNMRPLAFALPLVPTTVDVGPRVSLHFRNAELGAVLTGFATQAHRNLAVAAGVRTRLSIDVDDVPWRIALARIALSIRADVTQLPGGTLLLERMRFPRLPLRGQVMPLHSVLEALATRARATLLLDAGVEGVWTRGLPSDDPAVALASVAEEADVHAARFGSIVVVSKRPLPEGDADLDPEHVWRDGLPDERVTVAGHDLGTAEVLESLSAPERTRVRATGTFGGHARVVEARLEDAPLSDVVLVLAHLENASVRRDAAGIVLGAAPPVTADIHAVATPSAVLLPLVAEIAGKEILVTPRVRGRVSARLAAVSPEDALEALASLEGLLVLPLVDGACALVPASARPLESLAPPGMPTRIPDGRTVPLRLSAIVSRDARNPHAPGWAIVEDRALRVDDELVLPGAPPGERARVFEINPGRCMLEVSGPTTPETLITLVVR